MNLLAASGAWALDIVFFVIVIVGILLGVRRGFIGGICRLAGTLFSVAFAAFFCMPMRGSLEDWFGLTTALTGAIGNTAVAEWISLAISFVVLVVLLKVGTWLLGKVGTGLVDKIKPLKVVNRVLGGLLGLLKALILLFFLLAICNWINASALNDFIGASAIVGKIYNWEWFLWATHFPGRMLTGSI